MKMKKAASLVLVASLALTALAACGGSEEEQASNSDTFMIGGIGPTTGDAAAYGTAVQNGAQLAVDEINAAGGINGKQVEFQFEDDQSDSEKSVNAYNTLKDWGMQMLVGTVTSNPCTAVVKETYEDNMFQLTPSATAVESIQYDNAFRMCFSDPSQGTASADYIADNNLGTKIAVIYNNADAYSTGIYQTFEAAAAELGLEIVSVTTFTDDTTDFSVQVTEAREAGADLVFLPIYYTPASMILQQANSMDYAPVFFGVDGMDGILNIEGFDTSLAEGVMLLTPFNADAEDEKTQNFVAKYEEQFGETPNQFAADAYDGIYALYTAVQNAGITPETTPEEACELLIAQFPTLQIDGLTGSLAWESTGEVTKTPNVYTIEGGVYVKME